MLLARTYVRACDGLGRTYVSNTHNNTYLLRVRAVAAVKDRTQIAKGKHAFVAEAQATGRARHVGEGMRRVGSDHHLRVAESLVFGQDELGHRHAQAEQ